MTSTAAIIVAAGRGTRAGGETPKQWQPLAGRRVIDWTIDAFRAEPAIGRIVLVLHPDDIAVGGDWPDLLAVAGGDTRTASVRAGLDALAPTATENVLVHDAARPLVPHQVISDVIAALETSDGAAPGIAVTDALWHGTAGQVTGAHPRDGLFRAQTPQGFRLAPFRAAHTAHEGDAADDVEIARAAGMDVAIVPGDERNLKITLPGDFARAEAIMRQDMDVRLGNGYDVHRFGPGDRVTLCGVTLPYDRGLKGHSDADVGMHALTDAIYGALAEGDIGRHFPPSDPQWKGADSRVFLDHAVELAAERGYRVGNADVTLVCEHPKIGPHAAVMQDRLSAIMGLPPGYVSVKATTSEQLGFTGRGEGIAALATATLVPK